MILSLFSKISSKGATHPIRTYVLYLKLVIKKFDEKEGVQSKVVFFKLLQVFRKIEAKRYIIQWDPDFSNPHFF